MLPGVIQRFHRFGPGLCWAAPGASRRNCAGHEPSQMIHGVAQAAHLAVQPGHALGCFLCDGRISLRHLAHLEHR
jgi:hypothetical protein